MMFVNRNVDDYNRETDGNICKYHIERGMV